MVDQSELRPLAVVTGGSSGIGYELAKQFLVHGYDVLINSDNQARLNEARGSLEAMGAPASVQTVEADLSHRDGVEKLHQAIKALGRPVDALAANAGVGVWGDFASTDLEAELALIQLNVTSQVHLIKLVLKDMLERGRGRILITSSIAGVLPGPREAVYAASKAFLRFFAEALHNELKDTEVTITALLPGPTDTNFFHRAGMDETVAGKGAKDDPAEVALQGFEAMMKGDDRVVAGAKHKAMIAASGLMPDTAKTALHGAQTKPA
jgi:short-subunit dehydrogenase